MLSNNFTGGIALESFRAWLPASNDTRATEHKNSVVRHCLNEEAVPSFNRQRCQISIGLFHQSPRSVRDERTKSNNRQMKGSHSRKGGPPGDHRSSHANE